jgi:hypothetical protein
VHLGLPLEVLLGRTVLPTVARWFVLGMDNFIQVWAAWRGVEREIVSIFPITDFGV